MPPYILQPYFPTSLPPYVPTSFHPYFLSSRHPYILSTLRPYGPTSSHPHVLTSLNPPILTSLYPYIPSSFPPYAPTPLFPYTHTSSHPDLHPPGSPSPPTRAPITAGCIFLLGVAPARPLAAITGYGNGTEIPKHFVRRGARPHSSHMGFISPRGVLWGRVYCCGAGGSPPPSAGSDMAGGCFGSPSFRFTSPVPRNHEGIPGGSPGVPSSLLRVPGGSHGGGSPQISPPPWVLRHLWPHTSHPLGALSQRVLGGK